MAVKLANELYEKPLSEILEQMDFDEDRTFFRITIPCHEAAGNIIADVAKMDTTQTTTQTTTQRIIEMMKANSEITIEELAATCEITRDGVNYHIRNLKKKNKIRRIGGDFGGHWKVIDDKES